MTLLVLFTSLGYWHHSAPKALYLEVSLFEQSQGSGLFFVKL